jgi:hypothetical protein
MDYSQPHMPAAAEAMKQMTEQLARPFASTGNAPSSPQASTIGDSMDATMTFLMECHRLADTIMERLTGPVPCGNGKERLPGLRNAAALTTEMSNELHRKLMVINDCL